MRNSSPDKVRNFGSTSPAVPASGLAGSRRPVHADRGQQPAPKLSKGNNILDTPNKSCHNSLTMKGKLPKTLMEAVKYFSDEQTCIDFVASLRWENGVALCPHCRSDNVGFLATRKI